MVACLARKSSARTSTPAQQLSLCTDSCRESELSGLSLSSTDPPMSARLKLAMSAKEELEKLSLTGSKTLELLLSASSIPSSDPRSDAVLNELAASRTESNAIAVNLSKQLTALDAMPHVPKDVRFLCIVASATFYRHSLVCVRQLQSEGAIAERDKLRRVSLLGFPASCNVVCPKTSLLTSPLVFQECESKNAALRNLIDMLKEMQEDMAVM